MRASGAEDGRAREHRRSGVAGAFLVARSRQYARFDESVPHVLVDTIQIQQVLLNLVKNAQEAMSDEIDDRRELTIETGFVKPDTVEVSVGDSGTGVRAENADHVFDAFYTTKPDGMGMGLAISRSIAESHGGRLWFTSNADRGCTFRFSLPVLGNDRIHDVRLAERTSR